jgi:hypothetical protein
MTLAKGKVGQETHMTNSGLLRPRSFALLLAACISASPTLLECMLKSTEYGVKS